MTAKTLGDIAQVISGYAFKSSSFTDSGVPVIKIKNIRNGYLDLADTDFVDKEFLGIDQKYHVNHGDVLISLTGSHMSQPNSVVGRVAYNSSKETALLNQRAGKVLLKDAKTNKRYLYYLLSSDVVGKQIAMMANGAASQANVSPKQVESIPLHLHDPIEQERISEIVGAYDDLILNNIKRIEKLNRISHLTYRQLVNGLRGAKSKRLGELAEINPEAITKKNEPTEITYIDISSVGTGFIDSKQTMLYKDAPGRARRLVRDGDLIWATVRPNRRQYAFIHRPKPNTVVSTGFAVIRPKELPCSFLYYFLASDSSVSYLINHATGAAYPAVNAKVFENMPVPVLGEEEIERFDALVEPVLKQVQILYQQNELLSKSRELILPRLVNGKMDN